MTTDTLSQLELNLDIAPYDDTDDGQKHLAHIINPPNNIHIWQPGMTSKEIVEIARMTGQEVVALCGYRWIPKRNPDKLDVCKTCMDAAHHILAGE